MPNCTRKHSRNGTGLLRVQIDYPSPRRRRWGRCVGRCCSGSRTWRWCGIIGRRSEQIEQTCIRVRTCRSPREAKSSKRLITESITHFPNASERPVHHDRANGIAVGLAVWVAVSTHDAGRWRVIACCLRVYGRVCSTWHSRCGRICAGPDRANDTSRAGIKSQSTNLTIVANTSRVSFGEHRGFRERCHATCCERPVRCRYRAWWRVNNRRSSVSRWRGWRAVYTVVSSDI